jgi:hypothetical protein
MSDSDHLDPDANQVLAALRAAQNNAPTINELVGVIGATLERKNRLISILAEAVMTSDCTCSGCAQIRGIICSELEVQVVQVSLDPETLAKCLSTVQ